MWNLEDNFAPQTFTEWIDVYFIFFVHVNVSCVKLDFCKSISQVFFLSHLSYVVSNSSS